MWLSDAAIDPFLPSRRSPSRPLSLHKQFQLPPLTPGTEAGEQLKGCNVPEMVDQHAVTFSALFWGKRGEQNNISGHHHQSLQLPIPEQMQITPHDPVFLRLPREVLGPRAVPQPSLTGG